MRKRRRYMLLLTLVIIAVLIFLTTRWRRISIPSSSQVVLTVGGSYVDAPPQDWIGRLLGSRRHGLIDLLTTIRKAQADARIAGLVVRITPLDCGWAKIQDIRDALAEFRKAGKSLAVVLEYQAGVANKEYYLASVAERLYLAPGSAAPLCGLAAQSLFLGGLWDQIDVDMQVEKIREYKTAGDFLAAKKMSAANREMVNSLLDSLERQLLNGIATARGLSDDQVRALIDRCPAVPGEYHEAGLSDGIQDLADIVAPLRTAHRLVEADDYARVSPESVGINIGPRIAVVVAAGPIVTGDSSTSVQGSTVGADTMRKALEAAAEASDVRAIVLRVDSPGGSALASDLIWRAVADARRQKPVVVSMSDVAASGGYYVSAGATRIVAQPATYTGSIGVVYARPSIGRLLARAGINTETILRGKFAGMDDLTTPLNAAGLARILTELDTTYGLFISRVAEGRALSPDRVNEIGRGRVWTGEQAQANGLVDELGGFATALRAAKAAAGLDPEQEVELAFYPEPEGVLAQLGRALDARLMARIPRLIREILAATHWPFDEDRFLALMSMRLDIH
jgi:protease-4